MLIFAIKRVIGAVATLVVLTAVVFFALQRLVPGNEASVLAGGQAATPAAVHALEVKLGLTRPLWLQYITWLASAVRGDLGVSPISGLSITSVIAQEAPESLELGVLSLAIATVIGIPVGVYSAVHTRRQRGWLLRVPFLVLLGVPFFVSGSLLLLFGARLAPGLYSAVYIPLTTSVVGNLQSLFLPSLSAGLPVAALIMQMTRTAMLDVLAEPHVVTARSFGLSSWRIHYRYALKAALAPVLALEGFTFGILIGSLIVVEDVYSLPGLGRGVLTSLDNRDFTELEAQVVVLAMAFVVANLVVDILVPLIDKRVLSR